MSAQESELVSVAAEAVEYVTELRVSILEQFESAGIDELDAKEWETAVQFALESCEAMLLLLRQELVFPACSVARAVFEFSIRLRWGCLCPDHWPRFLKYYDMVHRSHLNEMLKRYQRESPELVPSGVAKVPFDMNDAMPKGIAKVLAQIANIEGAGGSDKRKFADVVSGRFYDELSFAAHGNVFACIRQHDSGYYRAVAVAVMCWIWWCLSDSQRRRFDIEFSRTDEYSDRLLARLSDILKLGRDPE